MPNREYYRSSKQTSWRSEPCTSNVLGRRVYLLRWVRIESRVMSVCQQCLLSCKSKNWRWLIVAITFKQSHKRDFHWFELQFVCTRKICFSFYDWNLMTQNYMSTGYYLPWYRTDLLPTKVRIYTNQHDGTHKKIFIFVRLSIRMAQLKILWHTTLSTQIKEISNIHISFPSILYFYLNANYKILAVYF
jgi:hypothetical protein